VSVNSNFSQLLRPVGQMPEPRQIESFSVKIEDRGVQVSAQRREEHHPPARWKKSWRSNLPWRLSTMTGWKCTCGARNAR